ncbi:DVU0298 family protein [Desulforamulus hydrothermalis]|uniref:PBS lyase HEAT domain protein repeat-containing protein n=1 Tax=Desulforamulus hydrothermalis Lam5 = DSM 18033 TaxID=1121428 RepID=K8E992_9FIRM|nr:DVU0298 family protein [Desulforamulus hydrothermalis]CCO08113.1 PBS lyase HEAT domain protein repeat-containing protein [Desulforamulus hydrothermalis Lam5 = DSM 18033]SHG81726.1 HEAT-like repeat-containing protein [Desulforamulus hydrothermalis Lam5 = DSM 18033]
MGLREATEKLLSRHQHEELADLAVQNRAAVKYLFRCFYHPYGLRRWQAIEGLGRVAEALALKEPESVREIIRRLLWSMNDESGNSNWSAPEAVGEIIYRRPDLFGEFVPIVVNAAAEEIFHRGIAWALGRIGQRRPDLVQEFIPLLINSLTHPAAEVRGYAAWALGQLGSSARSALTELNRLLDDRSEVEMYEDGGLAIRQVAYLAGAAIDKITAATARQPAGQNGP